MLLEELQWEGPETVEEIKAWGIEPLLTELELFDHYCTPDTGEAEDPLLSYFYYSMRSRVQRLQKVLYRMADQMDGKQKTRWREGVRGTQF